MAHLFARRIAALGKTGVNYVAASTSKPSDSFPGLTAIITGGSPAFTGVYYDVAYSRELDAPGEDHRQWRAAGHLHRQCGANRLTRTEYEEGIDIDQTKVNGGAPGAALTDGGIASIDPQRLDPRPCQGLQARLPVGIRPRQQHLQRHSPAWRIRGLVRQAPRLLFRRFRHRTVRAR